MSEIEAAEFKKHFLELLENLGSDGLIITRKGVPVARVLPYGGSDGDLIGSLRGKLSVKGDVFTTGCRWEADAKE